MADHPRRGRQGWVSGAANLAVLGLVLFLLVREEWPVGQWWYDLRAKRAQRKAILSSEQQLFNGPRLMSRDSATQLVEFTDYQCEFCKEDHDKLARKLRQRPDIDVVIKHFPLPNHTSAAEGARAAICSEEQDAFVVMHDYLFSTTRWQGTSDWMAEAVAAGIPDPVAFVRCLRSANTDTRLRSDIALGKKIGIRATPSYVTMSGSVHIGVLSDSALEALVSKK